MQTWLHQVMQSDAIQGFGGTSAHRKLDRAFGDIQSVAEKDKDGRAIYHEELHRRTHALFGTLITEKVAGRIGLGQPGEST